MVEHHEELVIRERVRDTYARYTHAGDRFRLDELADCFADDGVLEIKGRPAVTGRAAIRSLLAGEDRPASDAPPPRSVRHFVANLMFTSVSRSRVESTAYFQVITDSAVHAGLDHWGRYRDVLVPDGDRWVFRHRLVSVDAALPGGWYAARS